MIANYFILRQAENFSTTELLVGIGVFLVIIALELYLMRRK